jgi:hypothetical protein
MLWFVQYPLHDLCRVMHLRNENCDEAACLRPQQRMMEIVDTRELFLL